MTSPRAWRPGTRLEKYTRRVLMVKLRADKRVFEFTGSSGILSCTEEERALMIG